MLFITNLVASPFQKVCGNYYVTDVIICSTSHVHCNACHSKSKVDKSSFLQGSIATNDGPILLTIEGKWLEAIVHMAKFGFLNLVCPKQVQFLVLIRVCGKFQLSPTSSLVGLQENIEQFILEIERNLSAKGLVAPLAISFNDDV